MGVKRKATEDEISLVVISHCLKEIADGRMEFKPVGMAVTEEDKVYYKEVAIHALMHGMQKLAEGLNLPDDLKHTLILYESDLERIVHRKDNCE